MAYAEPLFNHLKEKGTLQSIALITKGEEDTPLTEIIYAHTAGFRQMFHSANRLSEMPKTVSFGPYDPDIGVDIETNDRFRYLIKDNEVTIIFSDTLGKGLSDERAKSIIDETEKLGYKVLKLQIQDV